MGTPIPIALTPTDGNYSYTINVAVDRDGSGDVSWGDCGNLDVVAHVVKLDLRVDSNNDCNFTDADDPIEENAPGRIVVLNNDDDNANRIPDHLDANDAPSHVDEDNLEEVRLTVQPAPAQAEIRLESSVGGERVRIWSTPHKDPNTEIALPSPTWSPSSMPPKLYVEGISPGPVMLDLVLTIEGTEVGRDKVALTVITIDMDVDADRDGVVSDTDSDDRFEDDWRFGDPNSDPNIRGAVILVNNNDSNAPCYDPNDPNILDIDNLDYRNTTIDGRATRTTWPDL